MNRPPRCLLIVALLFLSAAPGRGEDYPIRLSRPAAAGDRYGLSIVGSAAERVVVTPAGQKPQTQEREYRVEIEGTFEALEVDSRGRETKVSARLDACALIVGGARKELLPRGAVVVGESKDGKSVFTLTNGELTPQAKEALDLVFPVHEAEASFDDDAVFGTPARKKVGDAWPVNAGAAGAGLRRKGLVIRPEDVGGSTELAGVSDERGEKRLSVQSTFIARKIAGTLPGGLTIQSGDLQIALSAVVPVDPGRPRLRSTLVMKTQLTAKGTADDGEMTVEIRSERSCAYQRIPVKK